MIFLENVSFRGRKLFMKVLTQFKLRPKGHATDHFSDTDPTHTNDAVGQRFLLYVLNSYQHILFD